MFQQIYAAALDEPAIGYAASYKFRQAIIDCPKCGAIVWVRLKGPKRTPIGATCENCPWISTYPITEKLPDGPEQTLIDTGPPMSPPVFHNPLSGPAAVREGPLKSRD